MKTTTVFVLLVLTSAVFAQSTPPPSPNPDSMSIPFFPLQVGNQATYKFHYYNPFGCIAPPPSNDTTITFVSRDTVVNGNRYISLPQADFSYAYFPSTWFRTNGIDSVWFLADTNGGEEFYLTFKNIHSGQIDSLQFGTGHDRWPWLRVDTVFTDAAPFGTGQTQRVGMVYVGLTHGNGFTLMLDERFGLTRYDYTDDELCDGLLETLTGGTLNGVPFGSHVGVEQRSSVNFPSTFECTVSPNPAVDEVVISLRGVETENPGRVSVVNMLGTLMQNEIIRPSSGVATVRINVSQFPAGVYFVRSIAGGKIVTAKLVVVK